LFVVNKGDQLLADWVQMEGEEIPIISTITGMGIPELIKEILACTVSLIRWEAGEPVPYIPQLAEMIQAAHAALASWQPISAAKLLREALAAAE
jgi:hypothetical protein